MSVRVVVAPAVLAWALDVTGADQEKLRDRFKIADWVEAKAQPTLKQLQDFAKATGIPFGYLLLQKPPDWRLPIPDFREGYDGPPSPSADLMAVLGQSQRRQEWYREYVLGLGAERLGFVGSAATMTTLEAAARIRAQLDFEVADRRGRGAETRKTLLRNFEELGGLTVATSMVDNNTHRLLDAKEFRGFSLVDDFAPLVFVNTNQTLNGQIFTLAHEYAHVWRGISGIGNASARDQGHSEIERWCNAVASEVLVPREDLVSRHARVAALPLTDALEALAREFRCGTLVILQALHRTGARPIEDFGVAYERELKRLQVLGGPQGKGGGDYYLTLPYRAGERFSRALIADTLEGKTPISEAMRLMAMKSTETFDRYARSLGVA